MVTSLRTPRPPRADEIRRLFILTERALSGHARLRALLIDATRTVARRRREARTIKARIKNKK